MFLQNIVDGGQPLAIMNSIDKSIELFGDVDIPNHYDTTEIYSLITNINLTNYYNKTEIDAIIANINFSKYYTKEEVDSIDVELTSLILNTYINIELDTI